MKSNFINCKDSKRWDGGRGGEEGVWSKCS